MEIIIDSRVELLLFIAGVYVAAVLVVILIANIVDRLTR